MPRRLPLHVLVLFAILLSPAAFAWGEDGHYIVAELAWRELTPQARAAVEALLKDDPDKTIVEASTWADRLRKDHTYDWVKPLHYVNLPPDATGYDTARDCKDGKCVVAAIERFADVLKSKTATVDEKREALKFLIHFVGDLHCPMHVALARDKGGNDIAVEFFHDKTNLHRVWDSGMLRRAKKPWRTYADELAKHITSEKRKAWQQGTPATWATESWKLAQVAYKIPKDGVLGQAYLDEQLPVVEEHLLKAGVRLGWMLNEVLD